MTSSRGATSSAHAVLVPSPCDESLGESIPLMKFSSSIILLFLFASLLGCAHLVVDEPLEEDFRPGTGSGGVISGAGGGVGEGDPTDAGGTSGFGTGSPAVGSGGRVFGAFGSGGRMMTGSGGTSVGGPGACTAVMCNGSALPPPRGEVCFEFETSAFGGWQVSNAMGCVITLDGASAQPGQMLSAGTHTLKVSGCTNSYVSWSCWY